MPSHVAVPSSVVNRSIYSFPMGAPRRSRAALRAVRPVLTWHDRTPAPLTRVACPRRHGSRDDFRSSGSCPGPLAQLAEHRTFNPRVVGSSPTGPTALQHVWFGIALRSPSFNGLPHPVRKAVDQVLGHGGLRDLLVHRLVHDLKDQWADLGVPLVKHKNQYVVGPVIDVQRLVTCVPNDVVKVQLLCTEQAC